MFLVRELWIFVKRKTAMLSTISKHFDSQTFFICRFGKWLMSIHCLYYHLTFLAKHSTWFLVNSWIHNIWFLFHFPPSSYWKFWKLMCIGFTPPRGKFSLNAIILWLSTVWPILHSPVTCKSKKDQTVSPQNQNLSQNFADQNPKNSNNKLWVRCWFGFSPRYPNSCRRPSVTCFRSTSRRSVPKKLPSDSLEILLQHF